MKTDTCNQLSPRSPLRHTWRSFTTPITTTPSTAVPTLKVRPPSREVGGAESSSEDDQLEDEEARRLSVALMGVDSGLGAGFEGETEKEEQKSKPLEVQNGPESPTEVETMEIPIALDAPIPPQTTPSSMLSHNERALPSPRFKPVPRSVEDLRNEQSPSSGRSQSITVSLKPAPRPRPLSTHISRPLQLTPSKSPRPSVSVGNLRDFNEQVARSHKSTPSASRVGPLGRLAVAVNLDEL